MTDTLMDTLAVVTKMTEERMEVTDGGYGGKGSGLDLTSIILQQFSLSPGAGGKGDSDYGGGGGGVLVNGVGPNRTTTGSGEGYGGGEYTGNSGDGPGIVLIEINRRK